MPRVSIILYLYCKNDLKFLLTRKRIFLKNSLFLKLNFQYGTRTLKASLTLLHPPLLVNALKVDFNFYVRIDQGEKSGHIELNDGTVTRDDISNPPRLLSLFYTGCGCVLTEFKKC